MDLSFQAKRGRQICTEIRAKEWSVIYRGLPEEEVNVTLSKIDLISHQDIEGG